MKRQFLLICLLFTAVTAAAQVMTASLGGRITDENGPIEGVTVVLINQTTNAQYYASTDRRGWYHMQDIVPGGPFTVRIHYFGYNPLTVRNLYLYAGQNQVVDADLEAGTSYVRCDDAATAMRLGEVLGEPMEGGEVAFSPKSLSVLGQRVYTDVPFDVRQESTFGGTTMTEMVSTGSSVFHASAFGLYRFIPSVVGLRHAFTGNLQVSTPLGNEDYQLFGALQYGTDAGFSGAGRFDARFNESNRLDISGGHYVGESWGTGGWSAAVGSAASNRLQAGWYGDGLGQELRISDDFSYATGSQQMVFGVQAGRWKGALLDTTSMHLDVYAQDIIRLGRRVTLQAGLRFAFPFAFSPRASIYYDILGNGKLVLRGGTAVYGRRGGSTWKNLGAVDVALPLAFNLTLEATYSQLVKQLFYIKAGNVEASQYTLTAKLERPLFKRAWAVAAYTHSNGFMTNQVIGGFYYKKAYGGDRFATTVALLYEGGSLIDNTSPASVTWTNDIQARLSQDFNFSAGARTHTLQLNAFLRNIAGTTMIFTGLRYSL